MIQFGSFTVVILIIDQRPKIFTLLLPTFRIFHASNIFAAIGSWQQNYMSLKLLHIIQKEKMRRNLFLVVAKIFFNAPIVLAKL